MIQINVKDNESVDKALKRFKKKFERTGTLRTIRARAYYEKPSVARRQERQRAEYRESLNLVEG